MKNVRVSKKKYFEALENIGLYHEDGTIYVTSKLYHDKMIWLEPELLGIKITKSIREDGIVHFVNLSGSNFSNNFEKDNKYFIVRNMYGHEYLRRLDIDIELLVDSDENTILIYNK